MKRVTGCWRTVFALLVFAVPCQGALPQHSRAELGDEATRLQGLVQACGVSAAACRTDAVPEDEQVPAETGQPKTTVRWDWLRSALVEAGHASPQERQRAMQTSAARLGEMSRQAGAGWSVDQQQEFAVGRHAADLILARGEFGAVAPPGPWERFKAWLWGLLGRLFSGISSLGTKAPWLGTLFEWLFFSAAAVGLLLFVWRNFQRQRLSANLRGAEAAQTAWDREATDWAALAESSASRGEWREAVHCLYWAAIVRLEGRRLWRHNPARTPREYVRLLKPGSIQRESLGGLTGLLERVWYGLRPAAAEDYQRARGWFDRLNETAGGGERA